MSSNPEPRPVEARSDGVETDPRLAGLVAWFETLTSATVAELPKRYSDDARFKDPFNDVRGHAAIGRIFGHMFEALEAPRFTVLTRVLRGNDAFLTWDFDFAVRGRAMRIHGATHLRFAPDGRVALHRDYWDAAEELYAKLPVVGAAVRWLGRKMATPAHAHSPRA